MSFERVELPATVGAMAALGASLVLVPIRDGIGLTNSVILLTVVVVGAGARGGPAAGLTAGVVASFGVSMLHVAPYWQLRLDGVDDPLTGALLIVVGLAAGKVARWYGVRSGSPAHPAHRTW